MYKLRGIIGFYLTVAVLLTVALLPFEKSLIPVSTFSFSEEDAREETSIQSFFAETESAQQTDFVASESIPEEKPTDEDISTAIYNDIVTEEEITQSTEEVTEEITVFPEAPSEELAEEASSIKTEETVMTAPTLHNAYAPAKNENVYPLYFFSENVGSLSSADETNVYTFSLESRGVFYYTVSHKEIIGSAGWNISLYGEYFLNGTDGEKGFRLIDSLDTLPSVTKQSSVKLGLFPGNYRLVVTKGAAFTSDNYRIDVYSDESTEFEIECNDNIYRYTSLFSSVPIKGSASHFSDRQDEDWYMFRQYEDGFAELKFEHPAVKDKTTVCWQVILYSESGTVLYSVNSLFTDDVIRSGAIGLTKGNYYVLVRNRVYTDITYTLTLSRADDVAYENEQNDTKATANKISLNSTVTGSIARRLSGIDRDYFSFTVDTAGTVVLEFAHIPETEDKDGWNFVLTDEKGTVLYKGISKWSDDVSASSEIGLGNGTYYILVDSDNLYLNSSDYYLTVSYFVGDSFETESNNSFELADRLEEGIPQSGIIVDCSTDYDYDYYCFTLTDTTDISLVFEHEKLAGSRHIFTFTLYNEAFESVGAAVGEKTGVKNVSVLSDTEMVQADYSALPAGTYYVKVSSGLFYESVMYYLSFEAKEI